MDDAATTRSSRTGNGDNADGNDKWGDHVTVTISCELRPHHAARVDHRRLGRSRCRRRPSSRFARATSPDPAVQVRLRTRRAPWPSSPTSSIARSPKRATKWGPMASCRQLRGGAHIDVNLVNSQTFTPCGRRPRLRRPDRAGSLHVRPRLHPARPARPRFPISSACWSPRRRSHGPPPGSPEHSSPTTRSTRRPCSRRSRVPPTSPPINGCATVTAEVTITYGDPPPAPCDVPNMIGLTLAAATSAWSSNGFTDAADDSGQPKAVGEQTPNHPGTVSCTVTGKVKLQ